MTYLTYKHEYEVENIYDMMPPTGTIIGEATEKMQLLSDLECRHIAFMYLQDMNLQFTGDSKKDLYKDFFQFERDSYFF